MIIYKGIKFNNRKECKDKIGLWAYKKAARNNEIVIINDSESVLYGSSVYTVTDTITKS